MTIQEDFERILRSYVTSRTKDTLDSGHALWDVGKRLQRTLEAADCVASRPHLRVRWSFGQGAWARIPWLALLDGRETKATSAGVYVIYLFREDMSGLYLTLNQGVAKLKHELGGEAARAAIRERASSLRSTCTLGGKTGFAVDGNIDLHSPRADSKDYQLATVAHKFYAAGAVPPDDALLGDLAKVLGAYDNYLASKASASSTTRLNRGKR